MVEPDLAPFYTQDFTVDAVRTTGYTMRDNGKDRRTIEQALQKYVVDDPQDVWGVGQSTVDDLVEELFPAKKEQDRLW